MLIFALSSQEGERRGEGETGGTVARIPGPDCGDLDAEGANGIEW